MIRLFEIKNRKSAHKQLITKNALLGWIFILRLGHPVTIDKCVSVNKLNIFLKEALYSNTGRVVNASV